jgi:hypothetical protein
MVGAEHPLACSKHLPEQPQRLVGVAGPPGPGGDLVAGGEGVGVVGAKHPLPDDQHLPEQPQRLAGVTGLPGQDGDIVAGDEGVGVVGAERVLEAGAPVRPTGKVFGRDVRLPSAEHGNHLSSPAGGPQVLGLRRRRVAVQRIAWVVGLAGGKLVDAVGQGGVGGRVVDACLGVGAQILGEGGVEHAHVLLGRARGATDDQTAELGEHVADPSGLPGAAKPAACGTQQRQGQDGADTGGSQRGQHRPQLLRPAHGVLAAGAAQLLTVGRLQVLGELPGRQILVHS